MLQGVIPVLHIAVYKRYWAVRVKVLQRINTGEKRCSHDAFTGDGWYTVANIDCETCYLKIDRKYKGMTFESCNKEKLS